MARRNWKKEVGPFIAMASVGSATVIINTLYKAATLKGMENLDMRSSTTRIKIIGTVLSISGALTAVLFKGPTIISSTSSSPSPSSSTSLQYPLGASHSNWVIGGLLLIFQNLFGSFWYIVQNQVIETYPDEQMVSLIYFLCKTIIAVPICFIMEAKWSNWTVRPDIALVTIVVAGLFGPSYSTLLNTWVLHLKGPLYTSIFTPFSIAIAAALGVIFLGDALFLGSVLGATILLFGFYAVLWGKAQEEGTKDCETVNLRASPGGMTPLLQSCRVEDAENSTQR